MRGFGEGLGDLGGVAKVVVEDDIARKGSSWNLPEILR
jgi:hypothetical protein